MGDGQGIRWGRAITWGAYLACSWTWCIGMFLPLLLVRDLGAAGWWAFAIPNVVGAAAMGWVLRSSLSAGRLRAGHLWMGRAFSLVTIAFQVFFLAWMGGTLIPAAVMPLAVLVVGLVAAGCVLSGSGVRWLGVGVWCVSAGVLGLLLAHDAGMVGRTLSRAGELAATDVLWLTPVCVLGFALCPYLDLTFLRARRLCEGATGAAAFTVGFGVMFASMIVLTLAYGSMFAPEVLGMGLGGRPLWAVLCVGHIVMQAGFTIGVHMVELATPEGTARMRGAALRLGEDEHGADGESAERPMRLGRTLLLVAMVFSGLLGASAQTWGPLGPMAAGEVVYRCFMAFYGLVAPAYVWLCIAPGAGRAGERDPSRIVRATRRSVVVFVGAVVVASPFYAAGFLWREMVWLAPGVAVVLIARLLVEPRTARPREAASA